MGLNLDDLNYFRKICELKNVTRASEVLGISQPALSYSLKRLENEVGDQLIIRKKNGIELTKLGEEFNKKSQILMNEWSKLQSLRTSDSTEASGEYSLAIHPSVALFVLDKVLPKLTKKLPNMNFHLIHGLSREMAERVINWQVDFGIVVNPIRHPDLVIINLAKDEVKIFHRKNCQNKLIYDPRMAQAQDILKKFSLKKQGISEYITTSSLEVSAKLASLGMGYAVLPTRVAKNFTGLVELDKSPIFEDKICLVYRVEKHKNEIGKLIINEFKNAKI